MFLSSRKCSLKSSRRSLEGLLQQQRSFVSSSMFLIDPQMLELTTAAVVVSAPILGAGLWMSANYFVSSPNQYAVRTGLGVPDIDVKKWMFRWPFQKVAMVDVNPSTAKFRLACMSKEKVEFELPIVMTIGPYLPDEDQELFKVFCKKVKGLHPSQVEELVLGLTEGETRAMTAELTIEEMFTGKDIFRDQVISKLEHDLKQFGLRIYNANIQEMKDLNEANKYFDYVKRRAVEMANNNARRDVAEAKKQGDISVSEREKDTRIMLAENEKEARVSEYSRQQEILKEESRLAEQEAETQRLREVSKMVATQSVLLKEQEIQRDIEQKRYEQELVHHQSMTVAPAKAAAEAKIMTADAEYYHQVKQAEAQLKFLQAQAEGMEQLVSSVGGDVELLKYHWGIQSGLFKEVAKQSSLAVAGMKPNITVWKTGGGGSGSGGGGVSDSILDLVKGCVPIYQQVQKFIDAEKAKQEQEKINK